jgi:Domain of unknown function (DUF4157)
MPNKEPETPAQMPENFTSSSEMRQFALSIIQRRYQKPKQLQLTEKLQTKYIVSASQISQSIPKKYQPKLGDKTRIVFQRFLQQKPWEFAEEIPLPTSGNQTAESPASGFQLQQTENLTSQQIFLLRKRDKNLPFPTERLISTPSSGKPLYPSPLPDNQDKQSLEEKQLETKIEQSNYRILEPQVQNTFSRILNIRLPTVRIYANELADKLVNKYNADALTYPNKILFKSGKYSPQSRTGRALLGHELTHVAQLRGENQNTSLTPEAQETEALNNEQKLLHYYSSPQTSRESPTPQTFSPITSYVKPNPSPTTQPQIPKAALSSRDISLPTETNSNSTFQFTEAQLNFIKEEVYRDLKNRLRVEFERGS